MSTSVTVSVPESPLKRAAKDIIAGTVGGVGIVIVGHPFDTLKVRLQTQSQTNPTYSGLGDCVKKTYAAEGFPGFYKGVASPLVGQMFFNAIQFMAYGNAKKLISANSYSSSSDPNAPLTIPQCFAAGALTGSAVAFVEGPIDLFKTQLQTQVFKPKPLFTTFFGTVSYISSNFGIRGVYQGLVPTLVRNVPAVACYFGGYEWGKRLLTSPGQKVSEIESWKLLTAGAIGGFAYWGFTYPLDVIKSAIMADSPIRQERQYTGLINCAKQLYAQGGAKRFLIGLSPCLMRAAPANAVCFALYEETVKLLDERM